MITRFPLAFCDAQQMSSDRRRAPQQERSRRTVERIIDAAARVLERDGDRDATTNRIAKEAGVSPGSLYQYFADRDELLLEVSHRFVARFEAQVLPALRAAARADPLAAIRDVLNAIVDALEAQAPLLRALVAHQSGDRQEQVTRAIRARVTDFVFQTLARDRPDLVAEDLERVTWTFVELTQLLPVRWVLDRPSVPRDAFVEDLVRLLAVHAVEAGRTATPAPSRRTTSAPAPPAGDPPAAQA
jgi:AcrR family transcriptional regulator